MRNGMLSGIVLGGLAGCPQKDDPTDTGDTDTGRGDTGTGPGDTGDTGPGDTGATDTGAGEACAERVDGALVTIDVAGESFSFWSTDDPFVDTALAHLSAGTTQVPFFDTVVAGTDCDPQWSFHVAPETMSWADVTIELCDARPSYIDANLDPWMAKVVSWCPWSAVVTAVDDRR